MFGIPLDSQNFIYRARNTQNNVNGLWFAYDVPSALQYGRAVEKYSLKKDLKLINITHSQFHIDYMNKIHMRFPGNNDGREELKFAYLIPFGLPSFEAQKWFIINKLKTKLDIVVWTEEDEYYAQLHGTKFRYSDYTLDALVVDMMRELYGSEYDGFTFPLTQKSKLLGGEVTREICLFNRDFIELIDTTQHGGGDVVRPSHMSPYNPHIEEYIYKLKNNIPTIDSKESQESHVLLPQYNPKTEEYIKKYINLKDRKKKTRKSRSMS